MVEIRRSRLGFENGFTRIPNTWARDARLSRKARGLLAEILSHSDGWVVTEASLVEVGVEGRDSVRSGLAELIECGYLVREQERVGDGRFGASTMELVDPWADNPQDRVGSTVDGKSVSGESADHIRRPFHQKNNYPEDQEKITAISVEDEFAKWYAHYPRKVGKEAARKAYATAARKIGPGFVEVLRNGLAAFSRQMQAEGRDMTKIPHPSTWLNQGRWEDEHPGADRPQTAAERMLAGLGAPGPDWGDRDRAIEA